MVAVALVTGWLGGELVDRLGVGVDPGAHLNSPSLIKIARIIQMWQIPTAN